MAHSSSSDSIRTAEAKRFAPRGAPLPEAVVIGPMKCGTTWLHGYLSERGDVCLPAGVKETFYFDRNYDKDASWYRKHFAGHDAARHVTIVEVAPSYFHCDPAPERIRNELGDIPLVAIVRDPVRRAWSHYCHLLRYGYTRLPLQAAAVEFPAILDASRYGERLAAWSRHFSAIKLCSFEKLKTDEAEFCREACEGLAIPFVPPASGTNRERNSGVSASSQLVANASRRAAHQLRRRRLHFVVNAAKRVGLKRIVYGDGAGSAPPQPSAEELSWLEMQLRSDLGAAAALLDSAAAASSRAAAARREPT